MLLEADGRQLEDAVAGPVLAASGAPAAAPAPPGTAPVPGGTGLQVVIAPVPLPMVPEQALVGTPVAHTGPALGGSAAPVPVVAAAAAAAPAVVLVSAPQAMRFCSLSCCGSQGLTLI